MRRRRRPQSDSHVSSFPTDFVTPDPFRYVASQEPSFLQTAVAGDAERARKASYGGFGLGMRGASGEGAGGFHSRNGSTMSSVSLGMGMSESGNTRPSVLPRKPAPKLLDHMDVGSGLGLGYGATMTRPTSQLSQVSHFTGFSMVNPYSFPNAGDANENDIADADVRGLGQTQTRQNHPSNPFADQNPFEDPAVRKRDSYGGLGVGQSPHGRRRSLQVGPDAVARLSGVSASSSNFKVG
ncbi:hypothetical protein BDN72DRAFT_506462 [Pluteus cervinus]|uniref:Uncharacterized protein n=1 Tax=Pluteus cervinus TaxID=181527 RepID=A0ACD3A441_9AGAR|nr:hypothetical protein BDN72DRAFT_506462 [Pluteus cervinus]